MKLSLLELLFVSVIVLAVLLLSAGIVIEGDDESLSKMWGKP